MSNISSFIDDPSISDESINKTVKEASEPLFSDSIVSAKELWGMEFPPLQWVIRELLPFGLNFLGGLPNTYKSWLIAHMVECLGNPDHENNPKLFLDRFEVTPMNLLVIDEENALRDIRNRLQLLGVEEPPNVLYAVDSEFKYNKKGFDQVEEVILEHDIKQVITDPHARFYPDDVDENSSVDAARTMRGITRVMRNTGASWLIAHHFRKPSKDNGMQASLRGSSDWTARADAIITVTPDPDDKLLLTITQEKLRQEMKIDPFVIRVMTERNDMTGETKKLWFENEGTEKFLEDQEQKKEDALVFQAIKSFEGVGASASNLVDRLKGMKYHMPLRSVQRWLKEHVDEIEDVNRAGHGRNVKYYLPPEEEDTSVQTSMPYNE